MNKTGANFWPILYDSIVFLCLNDTVSAALITIQWRSLAMEVRS